MEPIEFAPDHTVIEWEPEIGLGVARGGRLNGYVR